MKQPVSVLSVPFFSGEFAAAYITTMRPYLLFVSGMTGVAGLACTRSLEAVDQWLIFVAAFLSYGFGQALTDCFQTDTDSISAPYRPLTQGRISRLQVLVTSLAGLAACITIYSGFNPLNAALGGIAGLGLATYTPFKRRWWGGPWYNAWIVALLCLMSMLTDPAGADILLQPHALLILAVVFSGYANFVLAGYFKDIDADRATGYNTLPVVFGRTVAAWWSDLLGLLALSGAVAGIVRVQLHSPLSWTQLPAWLFCGSGAVAVLISQFRLHRVRSDAEAHRAITPVVHAYILLVSGMSAALKPSWTPPLLALYAAFNLVLHRRPNAQQI